jgi:hypothetical protein
MDIDRSIKKNDPTVSAVGKSILVRVLTIAGAIALGLAAGAVLLIWLAR